jgi:hypothetical protein
LQRFKDRQSVRGFEQRAAHQSLRIPGAAQ